MAPFLGEPLRRAGFAAATLLAVSFAGYVLASSASAQPRHGAKPKPKPTAAHDAGASEEPGDERATLLPAGDDGGLGPVPAPVARPDLGDGGVKASPLNPAPAEFSSGNVDAGAATVDYDRLLGDIAALRARVAAVGDTLFHSRLAVSVKTDGDHAKVLRFSVSVDDGVVYSGQPNFHADDMTVVYGHAVAPGRHAVTVDVERKDDRNDAFRNAERSRFIVEVPEGEQLDVEVKVIDDSAMGADFPGDHKGSYDMRLRVKAASHPLKR